jgi:hypothetical protein
MIIICWQPWRDISGGTAVSTVKDVIGSGLNKEDPERAPIRLSLPAAFHLQGWCVTRHQQRGVHAAEVCVVSETASFEVSLE